MRRNVTASAHRRVAARLKDWQDYIMDDVIFARALHVLGVVIWIGGVAMATMVVLPAVRRGDLGADRMRSFQAIEHRFIWIARAAVLVVGLTGLFMIVRLDIWDRFQFAAFWWMHAMVIVWLMFAFVLFIGEPFILHRFFPQWVREQPDAAFATLHRVHWVLLALSVVTIFGAVAGVHGWTPF
jgi:uncharacterized membrane protein